MPARLREAWLAVSRALLERLELRVGYWLPVLRVQLALVVLVERYRHRVRRALHP